jgi:hypothetical protein
VENHPRHHIARGAYLSLLYQGEDFQELCRVSRDGVELFPDKPDYHFFVGVCHAANGDFDVAEAAFDRCRSRGASAATRDTIDGIMKVVNDIRERRGK